MFEKRAARTAVALVVWAALAACGGGPAATTQQNPGSDPALDPEPSAAVLDPGFSTPANLIPFTRDASLTDAQNGDRLEVAIEALEAGDLLEIGAGRYVVSGRLPVDARGTEQDRS